MQPLSAVTPPLDAKGDNEAGRAFPLFNAKNRAGLEGTLHRISAMKDESGQVIGLTLRIGRHQQGVA